MHEYVNYPTLGRLLLLPVGLGKKKVERLLCPRGPSSSYHHSVVKETDAPSPRGPGAPGQSHRADPVSQESLHPVHSLCLICNGNQQICGERADGRLPGARQRGECEVTADGCVGTFWGAENALAVAVQHGKRTKRL